MTIEFIQGIRIIIIALLSYIPTIAFTGWFEAWVAKKNGDEIPEQLGFLTLDPLVHFNLVGFGILLVGKLFGSYLPFFKDLPGWGRYIPLHPVSSNRTQVLLQFTARAIGHLILLFAAFFIIVASVKLAVFQMDTDQVAHAPISSMVQAFLAVVVFFYRQNFVLSVIYFVIGFARSAIYFYFPEFHLFSSKHAVWAMLLFLGAIVLGSQVVEFFLEGIMSTMFYLCMPR